MSALLSAGLPHAPYAIVLGITGNWAFTAGTLLLALHRHNPHLTADYLLFADATLPPQDAELLQKLGAHILPFPQHIPAMEDALTQAARQVFSPMSLSKFECFLLLEHYEKVLWLDTDILIQDTIEQIFTFGPLAMAIEDPAFTDPPSIKHAGINTLLPIADLDPLADNYNSGVIVFDRRLPHPQGLHRQCIDFIKNYGNFLRYPDQAVFNIVVQQLRCRNLDVEDLPLPFNTHPRNPQAPFAPIVHTFGAYTVWNDGFTAVCFPEWQRDYARWVRRGGTPYCGPIDNEQYLQAGAFQLICGLHDTLTKAEEAVTSLNTLLQAEKQGRARLEALLRKK